LPVPLFIDEVVERVLGSPVVRGDHIVLKLAVVFTLCVMTPGAVAGSGLEIEIVVVGILVRPLVVHRHVNIAFPDHVFNQRLGLDDLLDTGQCYGFWCFAVGQGDAAVFGRLQRLGLFTGPGILFDQ